MQQDQKIVHRVDEGLLRLGAGRFGKAELKLPYILYVDERIDKI